MAPGEFGDQSVTVPFWWPTEDGIVGFWASETGVPSLVEISATSWPVEVSWYLIPPAIPVAVSICKSEKDLVAVGLTREARRKWYGKIYMCDVDVFPKAVQLNAIVIKDIDRSPLGNGKVALVVKPACVPDGFLQLEFGDQFPSLQSIVAMWPFLPARSSCRPLRGILSNVWA